MCGKEGRKERGRNSSRSLGVREREGGGGGGGGRGGSEGATTTTVLKGEKGRN